MWRLNNSPLFTSIMLGKKSNSQNSLSGIFPNLGRGPGSGDRGGPAMKWRATPKRNSRKSRRKIFLSASSEKDLSPGLSLGNLGSRFGHRGSGSGHSSEFFYSVRYAHYVTLGAVVTPDTLTYDVHTDCVAVDEMGEGGLVVGRDDAPDVGERVLVVVGVAALGVGGLAVGVEVV